MCVVPLQDVEPEVLTAFVAGFNLRDLDAKIMAAQRGNNSGQVVLAPGAATLRRSGAVACGTEIELLMSLSACSAAERKREEEGGSLHVMAAAHH
jgi:hypothetical protein